MNRTELKNLIIDEYGVEPDYPWIAYPDNEVFRHSKNKKWFALIMDVSRDKLGLESTESISIVNVKCDPVIIGSIRKEPGFFPAYHMSKGKWISTALDGSASDEIIRMLLEMSYNATALTIKKANKKSTL